MKRFGLFAVAAALVAIPIAYGVLSEHAPHTVQVIAHPNATKSPAKEPRFIRIPNATAPCRCIKVVPTFQGKIRYDPLNVTGSSLPVTSRSHGSLWQGLIRAIRPTSVTVGHITCTRNVPQDLNDFQVGSLVVINCSMGHLVGIGPASPGLYTGSVPIAPAGR